MQCAQWGTGGEGGGGDHLGPLIRIGRPMSFLRMFAVRRQGAKLHAVLAVSP